MDDVVFVTGRQMPKPDTESHLLIGALAERGVSATVQPWGDDADWSSPSLVVIRSPWDYYSCRPDFLGWASRVEQSTRLLNPGAVLTWNSHKGYLLELQTGGVATVPTTLVRSGATSGDQRAALDSYRGEVVTKPAVSIGAIGALRGRARSEQMSAHLATLVGTDDALVQPLVESVPLEGETSLIFFGGIFSHAVRKVPAPGDYRVQSHHGGQVLDHTPTAQELEVASAALALAPSPVDYARVDLVRLPTGPAVMELELIEPELFLARHPPAAGRFADHLAGLLAR